MQILLSNSQAGPGRTVKQEQEEISRNHVQTFISPSVYARLESPKMDRTARKTQVRKARILITKPGPEAREPSPARPNHSHKSSTQPTAVLKIEGHCAEVVSARQLDHRRSVFSAAVRAR